MELATRRLLAAWQKSAAPSTHEGAPSESGVRRKKMPNEVLQGKPGRLGPYELLEPLGSGATAHVFRARHVLLGRSVAIKVLRPELADDRAAHERLIAEARAANLIDHPNVVAVTDIAIARRRGQVPWFVMELLHGADLATLSQRGEIDLARALSLVRQVCEGLHALHAVGVVHRDIKPENVFVTQREGRDLIKLIDFGIAWLLDPDCVEPPVSQRLVGTPDYMAPEQAGEHAIDHRADLYAAGSLLFDLIAGEPPFTAPELGEQLAMLLHTEAPLLSSRAELPDSVREPIDTLVARCLAKDPRARPASAREIIAALDEIMQRMQWHVLPTASPSTARVIALREAPKPARPPRVVGRVPAWIAALVLLGSTIPKLAGGGEPPRAASVRGEPAATTAPPATEGTAEPASEAAWIAVAEGATSAPEAQAAQLAEPEPPPLVVLPATPREQESRARAARERERSARRKARARAEPDAGAPEPMFERPTLVVSPQPPREVEAAPSEPPAATGEASDLDRDGVLNPFR